MVLVNIIGGDDGAVVLYSSYILCCQLIVVIVLHELAWWVLTFPFAYLYHVLCILLCLLLLCALCLSLRVFYVPARLLLSAQTMKLKVELMNKRGKHTVDVAFTGNSSW